MSDSILTEEEGIVSDDQVRELAEEVCKRQLQDIVLFFLEAHRPLRGVVHQLTVMSVPLFTPFFGASRLRLVQHIMESDEKLQLLMDSIEEMSKRNSQPVEGKS